MVRTLEGQMKELFQRKNKRNYIRDQFVYHLDNVTVKFGTRTAIKSVNLTINPGEILFVTGKSGAGKTTLLNVLAGDLLPTKGKVFGVENKTRFVSQVFQDLKLFENETCEQNIWYAYDSSIYKKREEFYSDMMELVKVLGIGDKLSLKITEANGGLKQKVAMIRALVFR